MRSMGNMCLTDSGMTRHIRQKCNSPENMKLENEQCIEAFCAIKVETLDPVSLQDDDFSDVPIEDAGDDDTDDTGDDEYEIHLFGTLLRKRTRTCE